MNHLEHIEEIAPRAAEIYGQDYAKLDASARQIYYETIRATARLGGQTALEKACGQAINEFYTGELTPDVYSKEAEEVVEDAPDTAPLPEAPKPNNRKKKAR
jgi:hypothetical protein